MKQFEIYTSRFGLTRFPQDIMAQSRLHILEMVVWGLDEIPRWGGHHGRKDWTVLQHSALVANITRDDFRAEAYLHDCTESLIGDMVGPVKKLCPDYQALESDVYWAIMSKLFERCMVEVPEPVLCSDKAAQNAEAWQFFPIGCVHPEPTKQAREALFKLLEKPVTREEVVNELRELLHI